MLRGCVSVAVDAVQASLSNGEHLMVPWGCRWSSAALSLTSCPLKQNWMSLLIQPGPCSPVGEAGDREVSGTCGMVCTRNVVNLNLPAPLLAQSRWGGNRRRGSLLWPLGLAAHGVLGWEEMNLYRKARHRLCTAVLHHPVFWRENIKAQRKEKSQPLDFVGVCNTGCFFLFLKKRFFGFVQGYCFCLFTAKCRIRMSGKDTVGGYNKLVARMDVIIKEGG